MKKFLKKSLAAIITVAVSTAALSTVAFAESKSKNFGVGTAMATAYLSVSGDKGSASTSINRSGGRVDVFIYGEYYVRSSGKVLSTGYGGAGETAASAGVSKSSSSYWIYVSSDHTGSYDGSQGSTSLEIKLS